MQTKCTSRCVIVEELFVGSENTGTADIATFGEFVGAEAEVGEELVEAELGEDFAGGDGGNDYGIGAAM